MPGLPGVYLYLSVGSGCPFSNRVAGDPLVQHKIRLQVVKQVDEGENERTDKYQFFSPWPLSSNHSFRLLFFSYPPTTFKCPQKPQALTYLTLSLSMSFRVNLYIPNPWLWNWWSCILCSLYRFIMLHARLHKHELPRINKHVPESLAAGKHNNEEWERVCVCERERKKE